MNREIIKGLFIFAGGMGVGYFIAKKQLKDMYVEELAEVKDFYMARISEKTGEDPSDKDQDGEELPTEEMYSETLQDMGYRKPITRYNKPPLEVVARDGDIEADTEYVPGTDEEYEAELEARADEYARRKHENKSNGLPYLIDHQEFLDGPDEYDRQTLFYYAEDRTLCEEDDTVVEDEEVLVGFDYEDTLDMQTNAWVRNDAILVLYEIQRIDDSYTRSVANAVETPQERQKRIENRAKGSSQ